MKLIQMREFCELANYPADFIGFTANSVLRRDGALVMGRGAAQQIRDRFPGFDRVIGQRIREIARPTPKGLEYLLAGARHGGLSILAVQVKYHWQDEADLGLIRRSMERLALLFSEGRALCGTNPRAALPGDWERAVVSVGRPAARGEHAPPHRKDDPATIAEMRGVIKK